MNVKNSQYKIPENSRYQRSTKYFEYLNSFEFPDPGDPETHMLSGDRPYISYTTKNLGYDTIRAIKSRHELA